MRPASGHREKSWWTKGLFLFVLLTLIGSAVYAFTGILSAPAEPVPDIEHENLKSDYVLVFIQCILGIIVMFLPSVLEKRLHIEMPGVMYTFFIIFLYAAIYLGEVRSFYYRVPHWDLILHGLSGLMLGALSFSVINLLNSAERIRTMMSPGFVAVFAFSFALSMGVVWEVYEFFADGMLGLNMQKFVLESGEELVGRDALVDTMTDLIVDGIGAIIMSVIGYVSIKHNNDWLRRITAKRVDPEADGQQAATGSQGKSS